MRNLLKDTGVKFLYVVLASCLLWGCHSWKQRSVVKADDVPQRLVAMLEKLPPDSHGPWEQTVSLPSGVTNGVPRLIKSLDESGALIADRCAEALAREASSTSLPDASSARSPAAVAVYKNRADGVVRIMTSVGEGAGIVVSEPDVIVTNYHVVEGESLACIFARASETLPVEQVEIKIARVVSVKPSADLAMLRIDGGVGSARPVPLGKLDAVKVGEDVYAIGHPLGYSWSLTQGIVSQVRREFEYPGYFQSPPVDLKASVIQTQTPISSGNSGGPLFNDKGEVIGLIAFAEAGGGFSIAQGLNMAIAVNEIEDFLENPPPYDPPRKPMLPKNLAALIGAELPAQTPFSEVDLDGDGGPDAYALDLDGDYVGDLWVLDANGNGLADGVALSLSGEQFPNLYSFDENEDGAIDRKGLDVDQDGIIDFWLSAADVDPLSARSR